MPDWVSFSNGVTVLSLIVAAVAGLVTLRDKAAARTITELRTIIDGLRLDVERITKRETEYRADQEEQKRLKEIADNRANAAEAELKIFKEVVHVDGYVFLRNAPKPHHPLCPSCRAKGVMTEMLVRYDLEMPLFTCPIPECKVRVYQNEQAVKKYLFCDFD